MGLVWVGIVVLFGLEGWKVEIMIGLGCVFVKFIYMTRYLVLGLRFMIVYGNYFLVYFGEEM